MVDKKTFQFIAGYTVYICIRNSEGQVSAFSHALSIGIQHIITGLISKPICHWPQVKCRVQVLPFRCDSDPLIVRGVESIIFLSEVLFDALLLKVVDFLQLILCDEKFCG